MHAVILAAGRARRIGDIGRNLPKCLLEIDGRSLIEYSLENLVRGGISKITIVTGHCDGSIQQAFGDNFHGVPILYKYNPHYETTGSVLSLLVGARTEETGDLVVVESDILYHPRFIEEVLNATATTIMVADASGSGDEVFICSAPDDRLCYLGKAATASRRQQSLGEFAGITRLSAGFCRIYKQWAQRLSDEGKADGHYEELIFALARTGLEVRVKHCPSVAWTEVDTPEDLDRARNIIYPQLRHFWAGGRHADQPYQSLTRHDRTSSLNVSATQIQAKNPT